MNDHPPIDPVPAGVARPFWSVVIPLYEPDPEFLRQTIRSVLARDPGPAAMQIALVDDCSSSLDARECVPHGERDRVEWFRQPRHAGIGRNWNTCIERARGHWVHILHQDDLVRPEFYERLRAGIDAAPAAGGAFCRDVVIDAAGRTALEQRQLSATAGILADWVEHVFVTLCLRAPALVVKRSVYEMLGGFRLDLRYTLDWDMWKRIAASVPLWYEPQRLACYRRHPASASFGFIRSGANIAEIGRSIELSESLLPPSIAADTTRRAREYYTHYAVITALRALSAREPRAALAQIREARKLTSSLAVAREVFRLFT